MIDAGITIIASSCVGSALIALTTFVVLLYSIRVQQQPEDEVVARSGRIIVWLLVWTFVAFSFGGAVLVFGLIVRVLP